MFIIRGLAPDNQHGEEPDSVGAVHRREATAPGAFTLEGALGRPEPLPPLLLRLVLARGLLFGAFASARLLIRLRESDRAANCGRSRARMEVNG